MIKIFLSLIVSFCFVLTSTAQTVDSTLLMLDKTEITSGVLYPYPANDSNALWLKYDGITDTIANIKRWKQIYAEYVFYSLEQSLFPTIDSVIKKSEYEINVNNRVPILILEADYHVFKRHAVDSNLIFFENGKFIDNPNRTESPYIEKQVFIAAPFIEKLMSENITFFLSSDFCFSNQPLPSTFEIDFADGNGFRTIALGQTITINYTTISNPAGKTSSTPIIRVRIPKGSSNITSSSTMKASTCLGNFPMPDNFFTLVADIPFVGSFAENSPVEPLKIKAEALVAIKYGNGHPAGELHKPIVFVEGIDFGRQRHRLTSTFHENGDFGWCAFWGQDFDPNDPDEGFPEFRDAPILLNQLLANGYDVILLDFRDGATFIERNAMVLVKLLQYIQNQPQIGFQREPTVVVGASMGGQVARYALAFMEQNSIQHCAREYISFDSPHQGANIPISLQKWIEFFAFNGPGGGNQGAKDNINFKLDRPATKQLLLFHYKGSGGGFNTPERAAYNNTINAIGYPNKLRKVAIANGSGHSVKQPNLNSGDLLLKTDWSPLGCLNAKILQGDCYAIPNFLIFSGKAPKSEFAVGTCLALTVGGSIGGIGGLLTGAAACNFCVNTNLGFDTEAIAGSSNLRPLDNAPGGWRNTAKDIAKEFRKDPPSVLGSTASIDDNPQNRPGGSPNQSFIPTISALDINTTDLLFNASTIQFPNPDPNFTIFEAFYIPTTNNRQNQKHVQLDPLLGGNMEWALNEILDTENKLKSPLTSTSPNNGVFNYGRKESRFISSVIIGNGGQLNINANLPTDYGLATSPIPSTGVNPPASGSSLLMETCECGEVVVEIQAGGEFVLGEDTPNNKATVLFHKGSTLLIRGGGKLIIKNNSRLVIEKGAKLIYEPGAEIQLLGDEAVLEIQGELEVKDNATFTFTYPNANSGYLKFNVPFNPCQSNPNWACPVIIAGQNSKMDLIGANRNDKILEIAGEDMLIPEQMAFFGLSLGKAEFTTPGARLSLASTNYQLVDATFVGTVTNRGVVVWGNSASIIARCEFDNVKLRGDLYAAGNRLNVINSNFTNGANVETNGRGVFFSNVDFDNLNVNFSTQPFFAGWKSFLSDFPSVYNNGNIQAHIGALSVFSTIGAGITNDLSFSSTHLNKVSMLRAGVTQVGGELSMKCSNIIIPLLSSFQAYGQSALFFSDNAQLRMSALDGNGFNTISGSQHSIDGFNIDLLDFEFGFNDFSIGSISASFAPSARIPLVIGGNTNTYFNLTGPATLDPNVVSDPFTPGNQPKISISEAPCVLPQNCTFIPVQWQFLPNQPPTPPCSTTGGGGSTTTNPTGSVSPLAACTTCPTVNSANFSSVPFNQAILTASSFMEITDTTQNDISAVALFHEIFTTTTINFNDPNQAFLVKYAYSNMKTALQHCFVTGRITESSCVPVLENHVEQFLEVINIRKAPVTAQNVSEQFFLELDEALIYRLIGQRDEAIIRLEAINNCFLTERHRQILKRTIAATKIERDAINGTIPLMAAVDLMDAIPPLEIPSRASHIDTTATINPSAQLGNNVTIGSNVVIEQDVVIGSNTTIGNNVIIKKNTIVGENVVIEENTTIEKEVEIGNFTTIGSYTILKKEAVIGNHTTINDSVVIEKEVAIHDYVEIANSVTIKKEAQLGNGAFVGNNSIISKETTIGELSIVRENSAINDKVKLGNRNVLAKEVVVKNKTKTGKEVLVEEGKIIPPNKTICDNADVSGNFNFNTSNCPVALPDLTNNTNTCSFAMGYAQTRTNFLNGFTLLTQKTPLTGEPLAFKPNQLASFYEWNFGDCVTSTDETPTHTFLKPGIYLITLTQGTSCDTTTFYGAITVFPNPTSVISPVAPACANTSPVAIGRETTIELGTPACVSASGCASFIPLNAANCRLHLVWEFNPDTTTQEQMIWLNDTTLRSDTVFKQTNANGTFSTSLVTTVEAREQTVFAFEDVARTDTASAEATISSSFNVEVTYEGCAQQGVQFISTVSGGTAPFSYNWSFGSIVSTQSSPFLNVLDTGLLTINLVVTDANSCTQSFSAFVFIPDCNANARVNEHEHDQSTTKSLTTLPLDVTENKIIAYPNPTTGQVIFEYELGNNNATLVITDLVGKTINTTSLSGNNKTNIDLSAYPKGIYLYKIIGKSTILKSDKLILME